MRRKRETPYKLLSLKILWGERDRYEVKISLWGGDWICALVDSEYTKYVLGWKGGGGGGLFNGPLIRS